MKRILSVILMLGLVLSIPSVVMANDNSSLFPKESGGLMTFAETGLGYCWVWSQHETIDSNVITYETRCRGREQVLENVKQIIGAEEQGITTHGNERIF